MNIEERNKKYNEYVSKKSPQSKKWPSLFNSFWVGGVICCIGQAFYDLMAYFNPTLTDMQLTTYMLVILIFLATFLTAIGVYDRIGAFAGSGSIIPITGFANSIASPALEYKREGLVLGLCVKMFTVAGPVIVFGTVGSIIVGLIYFFI